MLCMPRVGQALQAVVPVSVTHSVTYELYAVVPV
jgi:hypothetical protein